MNPECIAVQCRHAMSDLPRPERVSGDVFLSVVIPAFDEVDRIGGTVRKVLDYLGSRPYSSELIVVLDGGRPGSERAPAPRILV